jgi:hypothetical protein
MILLLVRNVPEYRKLPFMGASEVSFKHYSGIRPKKSFSKMIITFNKIAQRHDMTSR